METASLNIILGAVIGFVVSILTTIVSHFLESNRANTSREWESSEKIRTQRATIVESRMKELEQHANEHFRMIDELRGICIGLFTKPEQYNDTEFLENRNATAHEMNRIISLGLAIEDEEIKSLIMQMHSSGDELVSLCHVGLMNLISNVSINLEELNQKIQESATNYIKAHGHFLKRIDILTKDLISMRED